MFIAILPSLVAFSNHHHRVGFEWTYLTRANPWPWRRHWRSTLRQTFVPCVPGQLVRCWRWPIWFERLTRQPRVTGDSFYPKSFISLFLYGSRTHSTKDSFRGPCSRDIGHLLPRCTRLKHPVNHLGLTAELTPSIPPVRFSRLIIFIPKLWFCGELVVTLKFDVYPISFTLWKQHLHDKIANFISIPTRFHLKALCRSKIVVTIVTKLSGTFSLQTEWRVVVVFLAFE